MLKLEPGQKFFAFQERETWLASPFFDFHSLDRARLIITELKIRVNCSQFWSSRAMYNERNGLFLERGLPDSKFKPWFLRFESPHDARVEFNQWKFFTSVFYYRPSETNIARTY